MSSHLFKFLGKNSKTQAHKWTMSVHFENLWKVYRFEKMFFPNDMSQKKIMCPRGKQTNGAQDSKLKVWLFSIPPPPPKKKSICYLWGGGSSNFEPCVLFVCLLREHIKFFETWYFDNYDKSILKKIFRPKPLYTSPLK